MCEKLSFGFVAWVVCEEPKRQREKVKLVKAPTRTSAGSYTPKVVKPQNGKNSEHQVSK